MADATSTPGIAIYSTPGCMQCKMTRNELKKKGLVEDIDFAYIDVSENEDAAALVKDLGYQSAPVIVAGDQHWSGFNPGKINALVEARQAVAAA